MKKAKSEKMKNEKVKRTDTISKDILNEKLSSKQIDNMTEQEFIAYNNKKNNYKKYLESHRVPQTRREFLASGLMAGTAAMVMPTTLSLLASSNVAQAQEACNSNSPGFMVLNLSGGASLAGNMLALDKGGNQLPNYGPVGLGSSANLTTEKIFGKSGPKFGSISGVLAGILANTSATTLLNTAAINVLVESNDDSQANLFDPSPLIAKAKSGLFLPVLGQNRNQPAIYARPAALNVGSLADIQNAIGVSGAIQTMNEQNKSRLFTMLKNLSQSQSNKLTTTTGRGLAGLVEEATGMNSQLIDNPNSGIDPQAEAGLGQVWNFNNGGELRDAAVVYNAVKNNATMGYLNIGGYDYHNQGRAQQDTQDTMAGTKIGQMLETAAVMEKPLCIMVTSDGSVGHASSSVPGSEATGDRGTHGSAYMFFYDPNGRPSQSASQVGAFTASGDRIGVDTRTEIGGSPELAVTSMVANYLSFAGVPALFESIVTRDKVDLLLPTIKVFKS